MASAKKKRSGGGQSLEDSLARISKRLDGCTSARDGEIVLRLSGDQGGEYCIARRGGGTTVARSLRSPEAAKPLFEVWGDAEVIRSILDGEKDAVKQFLTGGLRLRGDLRHFSAVAVELGILKQPL